MQIEELMEGAYLESKTIEYKGIIEEGKSKEGKNLELGWLKTLVAFANTEGGTLVIGVEDKSHKVVALEQKTADRIILMIHRQIRERIEPVIDYDISNIVVRESETPRYVLCVKVKTNKNLPVALHDRGMLGIYIRNFGRTDLATQEQIRDLVLMSDNTPYDSPFTETVYDAADFSRFLQLTEKRGVTVNEKVLISRGILSADRKLAKGALLFRDSCTDIRSKIVVTEWPGITKGSDVVNASEEYAGNLLEILEKTIAFVKNHSVNGYRKEADSRVEYVSYPARSVTEGIVNAIAHRNYYIQGSQIEVNIFSDRMEITSPGSLLGVRELHEEKNISGIIPRRRNDIICSMLELCRYMEEKGSGFDKIEADYAGYGENYRPYVSTDAHSFTLTLPDITFAGGVVEQATENPDVYVEAVLEGKNDLAILSHCFGQERTVREIAGYVGVTPSTFFRKNVIGRLVERGFLTEVRGEKVTKYRANPNTVKLSTH